MLVNPSINIAIGDYGKSCNNSFHQHFWEREKDLKNYASFYNLEQDENTLKYSSVNENEIKGDIPLYVEENADNQFSSDDLQFFLKGFINSVYNNQINLLDQLNTQVNFKIVNINIILSSFEDLNAELAGNLIKNIKELCDEGMISHIVVKVFVILSKDGKLLNKQEEITVYNNLEKLKIIQEDNYSIFSNIIFIDDKNTSAVFLDINPTSIGFVLNEFITYLMTNHYNMLGNLMNSELLGIGIGMLYFDDIYFQNFFRSKIIDAKIVQEQLDPAEHLITTSHYTNIRDQYFNPIVNGKGTVDITSLINACKNYELHDNCTLESYKFLLSHLTGDFKAVPLKEPLLHKEKISIYDTLYQLIKNSFPGIEGVEISDHKKLLDDIDNLKSQIEKHKEENEEGLLNEIIANMEKELFDKRAKAKAQKLQIDKTLQEFKRKDQTTLKTIINRPHEENIKILQDKRVELTTAFNKKLFFIKWFHQASHNKELAEIQRDIMKAESSREDTQKAFEDFSVNVQDLYIVIDKLELKYKNLKDAIRSIFELQRTYNSQYENSRLFDYLFIKHVIDKKLLLNYFNKHSGDLLLELEDSVDQLTTIKPFSQSEYETYLRKRIDAAIAGIIDFKMVHYLLNNYDELYLLKKAEPQQDISSLVKISIPFFNAENAFNTNNTHRLILHKDHNDIDTQNLRENLRLVFPVVPQQIRTLNPNKFSLVKIDVLSGLTSLVKYNMGKRR